MKRYKQQAAILFSVLLVTALGLSGCKKSDDNGLVFGNNVIYMPQALQSGGISLNYLVPNGSDSATRNYDIDRAGNRLQIILGVSRSGMQSSPGFSVEVAGNPDTVTQAIANGALSAVMLPDKDYSMPQTVTVPPGQTETTFLLSVDLDQLEAFSGQKVALAVKLSNPSKYSLNAGYSETIVIIDVDALNL